ncbi:hypothetical protein LOK49_LG04G00010 [Camellia lanceoleosa]|uniref:Uncharacterized protein n=1 Tax=Camellia lanceoleosa TaxID=1840588 RepID=A0ACC0I369_9ERIC|nr:hypothetical protein LOK49_LG04G00010 [Camellia lanceoleosa]
MVAEWREESEEKLPIPKILHFSKPLRSQPQPSKQSSSASDSTTSPPIHCHRVDRCVPGGGAECKESNWSRVGNLEPTVIKLRTT